VGIECDGPHYVSGLTVRDRTAPLAQLRRMGWKLHRVWSVEWFRNPRGSGPDRGGLAFSKYYGDASLELLYWCHGSRVHALEHRQIIAGQCPRAMPCSTLLSASSPGRRPAPGPGRVR
jgi:hypothetical protein